MSVRARSGRTLITAQPSQEARVMTKAGIPRSASAREQHVDAAMEQSAESRVGSKFTFSDAPSCQPAAPLPPPPLPFGPHHACKSEFPLPSPRHYLPCPSSPAYRPRVPPPSAPILLYFLALLSSRLPHSLRSIHESLGVPSLEERRTKAAREEGAKEERQERAKEKRKRER